MSFNQVLLSGHLVGKPEMRYSPKGTAVCKFSIESRSKRGQNEDVFEGKVTAFGAVAEHVTTLPDGSAIIVTGRLTSNHYTSKAGRDMVFMDLVATSVMGVYYSKPQTAGARVEKTPPVSPGPEKTSSPADEDESVPF